MKRKADGYQTDQHELTRVSDFIDPTGGGGRPEVGTSNSYRTMVQTIADHQNAVPIPKWPPYVIGVGASTIGAGSTLRGRRKFRWRREGDSNSRYFLGTHAFQACALNHSAISPTS